MVARARRATRARTAGDRTAGDRAGRRRGGCRGRNGRSTRIARTGEEVPRAEPAQQNKLDASRLARSRRAGDVWLAIADCVDGFTRDETLDPHGELEANGVRVALNGRALASSSRGGFTSRLDVAAGRNELVLTGVRGPLWLRVLALRLPFVDSTALLRQHVDGTAESVRCTFDVGAAAPARADGADAASG